MRAYLLITACLACVLVSGCSRSGDFSTFVVSEVAKHGGHTVTNTPPLPVVQARWTIESDTNGFQARVTGAPFTSIDSVMTQAFGSPKISVAANTDGQPQRVWAALDIGVAIQLVGRPGGADIICLRSMRDMGEMFQSMEKRP
jgi:hypothetical protein